MKQLEKKVRAYALKNALAYNGKAQQGAVISALFNEGLKRQDMKKYGKKISEIIKEVNKMKLEGQKKEFEKLKNLVSERVVREGLPELPNAKKGVVMRFAPSPSGGLHIGHALTACLSFDYVQKYGGKFIVRIEDTNPDNIYPKAYDLIKKDCKWLFKNKAKIVIQSSRMELYYDYAGKLINKGVAYVCTCSGDDFREFVKKKKDCPCRSLNVKENRERWENMLYKKGFKSGEAVLRFKSDMTNKNPAMRDFPLARVNETPHPLQKKKYRVWPLMNLCVSVDDIEMGMTHIIRAKEHRDNAERQKLVYRVFGKKFPWTGFLGRYKFTDLELSATKITQGIKSGKYSGWEDIKLPTVASLKKRGYKPKAFYKYAEHRGLSEVDKILNQKDFFEVLDKFNKE